MLISFPIAFLSGGVVFDLLGRIWASEALYVSAGHCLTAGIVTALLAAIPGIIDYKTIVPEEPQIKSKATYHMLLNSSAVVLFLVSLTARPLFVDRQILSMLPSYIALGLLGVGSWIGGSLVYDHDVGRAEEAVETTTTAQATWAASTEVYGLHTHH